MDEAVSKLLEQAFQAFTSGDRDLAVRYLCQAYLLDDAVIIYGPL